MTETMMPPPEAATTESGEQFTEPNSSVNSSNDSGNGNHSITESGGQWGSSAHAPVLHIARGYAGRGWSVLPIPYKSKACYLDGWSELRLSPETLRQHFNGQRQNIGVLLGEASGNLVDVDLDCDEAVKLAPDFLPRTDAVFGRASKPRSHYLYYAEGECQTEKFQDHSPGKDKSAMVVELRSTGCQTVMPASTHPSGEAIRWDSDGEPSVVSAKELREAVARLHAAVLKMRGVEAEPHKEAQGREAQARQQPYAEAQGVYATHDERHAELVQRIVAQAKHTPDGYFRMNGVCHSGTQSKTALMYDPKTNAVHCHGGCDYFDILRAFGLPDKHLPKFVNSSFRRDEAKTNPGGFPVLRDEALHGLAGQFVETIFPHTEADRAALLFQFLAGFGNIIGRSAYYVADGARHYTNLYTLIVGDTSAGKFVLQTSALPLGYAAGLGG